MTFVIDSTVVTGILTILQKRKKRKWISPNGRSCESIPKAIAMSVELGLLPPETIVPTRKKRPASPIHTNNINYKQQKQQQQPQQPQKLSISSPPVKKQIIPHDDEPDDHDTHSSSIESDPEQSLSPRITSETRPTTVHWDPDSEPGRKIGWKCRVWDGKQWRDGRVLLHDPYTRMHKIQFEGLTALEVDHEKCAWLKLEAETVQLATRLVWAHVKGFAWWPAMVMEGDALEGVKERKGHVLVAFIGSDDVATLRDSSDCLRDFDNGKVDSIINKQKKKRNSTAISAACKEQDTVQATRNKACRFYAEKAFGFANKQGLNLLGKRIQVFRDDVNYPYGDTVVGKVRQYSTISKKWLLSYEFSEKTKNLYESSWINLNQKEVDYKVLDKGKKPHAPLDEDIVPYMRGFVITIPKNSDHDCESGADLPMSKLLTERCRGCVDYVKDSQPHVTCKECHGRYHVGCVDPSTTTKGQIGVKANNPNWTCHKCTKCDGCWHHDITYGAHIHHIPKTVALPNDADSLNLCSMCITAYEAERFCPACAHTWNDSHYQKVKRQLKAESKQIKGSNKRKRTDLYEAMEELEMDNTDEVEASWYNPDSPVWGYTAGTMLGCDGCNLWVHAGCGGLTRDEYEQTSSGKHEIYSTEFLCRGCCKRRTMELILKLEQEDKMYLFAIPVTEQMAPAYHDIIKTPMDLQTMSTRAKRAEDLNYAWVRESFELMVLNALTFNPFHTKIWNEAKRYYHDCMKEVFSVIGMGAPPGRYAKLVQLSFQQAELEIKKEEQRLEQDEKTEKKDLVAGAQVATIILPPLRDPIDQVSCITFQEVKLKPLEAHFGAWMECCFTCGSSGAMDTMLFCVDCGEAFHSFCAGVPIHSMESSSVAGWRCPNCKVCEISGEVPHDENKMLFCEMCDRAFICDLLEPPLTAAPPGLWVCGQCVNCKGCGNTSENNGANLKHWSRDPAKCYKCGGCRGIEKRQKSSMRCLVGDNVWRKDDDKIATCTSLTNRISLDYDPSIEKVLQQKSDSRSDGIANLCYAECRLEESHKPSSPDHFRRHLRDMAWGTILEGDLVPPDSTLSIEEVHDKLTESIDWRMREMLRSEYTNLIKEARRMLDVIKERNISSVDLVIACKTYKIDLPKWMAQRAARFMQVCKTSLKDKLQEDVLELPIESLLTVAKMASAFLRVCCRALGLSSQKAVELHSLMLSLLIPPNVCGLVGHPIDLAMIDGQVDIILDEAWSKNLEILANNGAQVEPVLDSIINETIPEATENRKTPVDTFKNRIASPVCGWNHLINPDDESNRWADPRACCLCRTCGDDDADSPVTSTPDNLIIPHVGRLLPMSHGHWVHTSCALWSSEVYEAPGGGTINAMEKARSRGTQLKCFGCNRSGATVGCFKANCSRNFHFPCAKACGSIFTAQQQMFCFEHQDNAADILKDESIEQMKTLIIAEEKKVAVEKEPSDPNENLSCSRVGSLVVQSLGEIEQNVDGFHDERYIMPKGYCATRIFWSSRIPKSRTVYICKIELNVNGNAVFVVIPGDDPSATIRSNSVAEAYSILIRRVAKVNIEYFNRSAALHSKLPAIRVSTKKAFGLNGPQFFGFGLNHIRKLLEGLPGIEAVVAPLTEVSPSYRFSYVQPSKNTAMELQRKRAAVKAEQALENSSGSARSEGMKAMARSGGSGRITRALVRSVREDDRSTPGRQSDVDERQAKADRESNQVKYAALKAVPLTQRLMARRSHIHGWGLFTKVDIKKDNMIIEYMGEVVRQCIADKREKGYETSGIGSCYMFRLDLQRIVDATMIGCMARFMNHCCKNNAYAKVIGVDSTLGVAADKKIVVFAIRDIKAGEEITYDYKFPVEDGSLRCTCGAPNCIGRMN